MNAYDLMLPSYAKINLGLYVLGKRADGFHDIWTIFQELEFHDALYFRKSAEPLCITTNHPSLSVGQENLVHRAVHLLHHSTGCSTDVNIHIEKSIPLGAGLGGGSSNAAAALRGMNRLFALNLTTEELCTLGAQLGSDVPFFLHGGTAIATGRGEQICQRLSFPFFWVLLIFPGFEVSSGWAYKNLNLKLTNSEGIIRVLPQVHDIVVTGKDHTPFMNMLEEPVITKYPILGSIKARLLQYGADWALMSGSGSTVFGIFRDKTLAEHALQHMEQPDWMMVVTGIRQKTA